MRGRGRTGALGTFGGVFTPSLLTILGVVLFLRTGFVVGSGGLGRALARPRTACSRCSRPSRAVTGRAQQPRRGVLLAGGVALATIAAGSLNAIASVISMFFLISYGLLNYATYVEATGASPSFRPRLLAEQSGS
jgi:hypothetical protein